MRLGSYSRAESYPVRHLTVLRSNRGCAHGPACFSQIDASPNTRPRSILPTRKNGRSDGCPFAAWCTPAQRMSADNGERTAASIPCEPSGGLVRNLLRAPIAGDCEKPRPTSSQVSSVSSRITFLSQLSRAIKAVEQGHAFSLGASHCDSVNVHTQSMILTQSREMASLPSLRLKQPDRHFAVYSRVFRGHQEHFGNRAGYGADVSACSMLARMATSVSGKTASLVDVSSSTDHQR